MNLRMRKPSHIVIVLFVLVVTFAVTPGFADGGNGKGHGVVHSDCDVYGKAAIACERGEPLANGMPDPEYYFGLSRIAIQYCHYFSTIAEKLNQGQTLTDDDWAPIENVIDTENFQRVGPFLTDQVEVMSWQEYKQIMTLYGGYATWTGNLRRVTEVPGLVFLELEEHNTIQGITDVSNTVIIYKFNEDEKLIQLDVYIASVRKETN